MTAPAARGHLPASAPPHYFAPFVSLYSSRRPRRPYLWTWFRRTSDPQADGSSLPDALFDGLSAGADYIAVYREYATEAEARADLAAAWEALPEADRAAVTVACTGWALDHRL